MNLREWALPVYTILMQMAVGGLFVLWVIRSVVASRFKRDDLNRMTQNPILVISITCLLAMIASHFHLSRPFHSFLAVLNIETSWLSREILFTLLFFVSTIYLWVASRTREHHPRLVTGLGWVAIIHGFITVYCMAFIYILPTQTAWNSLSIVFMFYITTLLLGGVMVACLMVLDMGFAGMQKHEDLELHTRLIQYSLKYLAFSILVLTIADIAITSFQVSSLSQGDATARSSLSLLLELYLPLLIARGIILIYASLSFGLHVYRMYRQERSYLGTMTPIYLSSLLIIISEVLGRFLFYAIHVRIGI